MLSTKSSRFFSTLNKSIVVCCNSLGGDLVGARIMNELHKVAGDDDFEYFGYGGKHIQQAGLRHSEFDPANFMQKPFHTFRKTRSITEKHF